MAVSQLCKSLVFLLTPSLKRKVLCYKHNKKVMVNIQIPKAGEI